MDQELKNLFEEMEEKTEQLLDNKPEDTQLSLNELEKKIKSDTQKTQQLTVPPLPGNSTPLVLQLKAIKEAEKRHAETKHVTPATYSDLEFTFNEAYREAKANLSVLYYEIAKTERYIDHLKSVYLLDQYPEFVKNNKLRDNAETREGFLMRQKEYVDALDRLSFLKSLEKDLDGKIKFFESVCRFLRKQMDLLISNVARPE